MTGDKFLGCERDAIIVRGGVGSERKCVEVCYWALNEHLVNVTTH